MRNFFGNARFPHSFWVNLSKLCGNCALPQNFHIMKLGEILKFYVVLDALLVFDRETFLCSLSEISTHRSSKKQLLWKSREKGVEEKLQFRQTVSSTVTTCNFTLKKVFPSLVFSVSLNNVIYILFHNWRGVGERWKENIAKSVPNISLIGNNFVCQSLRRGLQLYSNVLHKWTTPYYKTRLSALLQNMSNSLWNRVLQNVTGVTKRGITCKSRKR